MFHTHTHTHILTTQWTCNHGIVKTFAAIYSHIELNKTNFQAITAGATKKQNVMCASLIRAMKQLSRHQQPQPQQTVLVAVTAAAAKTAIATLIVFSSTNNALMG